MYSFANLLLLSGPSGGGKSTFARHLQSGDLPEPIAARLPHRVGQWPLVDVTNHMRRQIEEQGEAAATAALGNPSNLILHYDITTIHRYGLDGYETDPALRLLRLARTIQVVFVCPDADRLYAQFVHRDAARQARKSGAARAWNAHVLSPLRKVRRRLSGQTLNGERGLYSDPNWIATCYRAWETYIAALAEVGAAQQVLRVAPCEAAASEQAFCIVSPPSWPSALAEGGVSH